MKKTLALGILLGAAIGFAATYNLQQVESATAVWANAALRNDFDGGAHVQMEGNVKLLDGGLANPTTVSVTCQGPAAFALITTCFQAWKDANGIP